jgi:hypothetical protein
MCSRLLRWIGACPYQVQDMKVSMAGSAARVYFNPWYDVLLLHVSTSV